VFCRPASFTPLSLRSADTLEEQLRRGRQLLLGDRFRLFFGCFQQETPTALATGLLLERCAMVLAEPDCVGLILSTRPDAIAADLPSALADLCRETGKDCLVELGVQSIHPGSLRLLNRNHGYGDFVDAVARLHAAGLEVGAHLILGIPGESEADMRASLDAVCALGVQALKLHHLQVIRATPLEEWYHQGRVAVFALDDYLRLLPHIPAQVTLHRLCATSHPRLLVAPRWGRLAADLSGQLQALLVAADLRQGQRVGVNG
jgi:radical SAM protein (TIGR01212 family)